MRPTRVLLSAVLVLLGLVLQVSVLGQLQLPGATPDLLMLIVVGLALVYGPSGGCLVGFAAGLLADLAPPSDHAIGRFALVLCLVGYATGLLRPEGGRPVRPCSPPCCTRWSAPWSATPPPAMSASPGWSSARCCTTSCWRPSWSPP